MKRKNRDTPGRRIHYCRVQA